jgi:hypothetical protein
MSDLTDRDLAELHPPTRNRYFEGKLLTASDLSAEQEYGRAAGMQLNRLVLGSGVVCGLEVTTVEGEDGSGVRIEPGLALDGWGRRIVVSNSVDVVPLRLSEDAGGSEHPKGTLPPSVIVSVRYRAFEAASTLAASAEVGNEDGREAGRWVESYSVAVREGAAEAPASLCPPSVLDRLREGDVAGALREAAGACDESPIDPSVPLAAVTADKLGALTVAADLRVPVPTNRVLLSLLACLVSADRRVLLSDALTTPALRGRPITGRR